MDKRALLFIVSIFFILILPACSRFEITSGYSENDLDNSSRLIGYWDEEGYNSILETIGVDSILYDRDYVITDEIYASLAKEIEEVYYTSNKSEYEKRTKRVMNYAPAIQRAIDDANAAGGGRVVIPKQKNGTSVYYSSSIQMKSNVCLYVDDGAELTFIRNISNEYYPITLTSFEGTDLYNFAAPIRAFHAHDISIRGKGIINVQADEANWWNWRNNSEGIDCHAELSDYVVHEWNNKGYPLEYRLLYDGYTKLPEKIATSHIDWDDIENVEWIATPSVVPIQSFLRPATIETYACANVLIEGIKIINCPMWAIHPIRCRYVHINNITIDSRGPNNDGINPESTQSVLIENCIFNCGDDCISIKAGKNLDGHSRGGEGEPSLGIIIRNCSFDQGHAGVAIGSETSGNVKEVYIHDCSFGESQIKNVLRIKTNSHRGGTVQNVYLKDCNASKCYNGVIQIQTKYDEENEYIKAGFGPYLPMVEHIRVSHLIGGTDANPIGAKYALELDANEYAPIEDVKMSDVSLYGVKDYCSLKGVKDLEINNLRCSPYKKPNKVESISNTSIDISNVEIVIDGKEYDSFDNHLDWDTITDIEVHGIIKTADSVFATGNGSVSVYIDRGVICAEDQIPELISFDAITTWIANETYAFVAYVDCGEMPNYKYSFWPKDTGEENARRIISIVAKGEKFNINTFNMEIR